MLETLGLPLPQEQGTDRRCAGGAERPGEERGPVYNRMLLSKLLAREAGEGELLGRYFLSHANGGTGTYLPPAAAATDSG